MKVWGSAKSVPRWVPWTITLVLGMLCFGPELWMLWSGPSGTGIIQPGTAISVRLLRPLTSASAAPGQRFVAFVVSSEGVQGSAHIHPGMRVEGVCVAVRRATANAQPGYIRLVLQGLRDSEGRFAPLETTTFSEWGRPPRTGSGTGDHAASTGFRPAWPIAGSPQMVASAEALLPTQENIDFVVLKPSRIPSHFHLPELAKVFR